MPSQQQSEPRAAGTMVPLLTVLVSAGVIVAVFLLVIGEPAFAASVAALLALLVVAGAFESLVARRKLDRHRGNVDALDADESDSSPIMAADRQAPLGATRQSHTDVDPHDLPIDHPSRKEVERERSPRGHPGTSGAAGAHSAGRRAGRSS